jgi:hypothetical protein
MLKFDLELQIVLCLILRLCFSPHLLVRLRYLLWARPYNEWINILLLLDLQPISKSGSLSLSSLFDSPYLCLSLCLFLLYFFFLLYLTLSISVSLSVCLFLSASAALSPSFLFYCSFFSCVVIR